MRVTITQCDRCKREATSPVGRTIDGVDLDFCEGCDRQLKRLLGGENVCDCEPP